MFFEDDRINRQLKEAELYHGMGKPTLAINTYFQILKANNNPHNYQNMWKTYQSVIRIIVNDFAVAENYNFRKEALDAMVNENPGDGTSTTSNEWGSIDITARADNAVNVLYQSIRNIRKVTK